MASPSPQWSLLVQNYMEELDYSAVSFINIDGEDFTWEWGGKPYTIKAGEIKYYPPFLANHLAKHLAYKMASGNMDKARGLMDKIVGTVESAGQPVLTKGEEPDRKIAEAETKVNEPAQEEPFAELKAKPKKTPAKKS
jgi:hypothetical protein